MNDTPQNTETSKSQGPWKPLGLLGNMLALVLAIGVSALWGREIVPDILRRQAMGYNVLIDVVFLGGSILMAVGLPTVGIVLASLRKRWLVGCGCTAGVVSVLGTLAAALFLFALSGMGAH